MRRADAAGDWRIALLRCAARLLPAEAREEQLAEWGDEVHCAREDGVPAGRRTLSIALRAAPVLAWRARHEAGRPGSRAVADRGAGLPRFLRESWALSTGRSGWAKAFLLAAAVALLDLGSKALVSGSLMLFEREHPLPHLTIFHVHNPGLSMSFIDGGFYIPASLAALGAGVVLLNIVTNPPRPQTWLVIGLTVGGTFGNLSERLYHGYVTDFLQVGALPVVFNLADLAICAGLLVSLLPLSSRSRAGGGYPRIPVESALR